jgi:hypothetical protein
MRHHSRFPRFVLALAFLLLIRTAPAMKADDHDPGCSYRSVAGNWSYRLSGSGLYDPNGSDKSDNYANDFPIAGVGTFTLDKAGNFSGGGPIKYGNHVIQVVFSGTSTVNSDCTGVLSLDTVIDGEDAGIFEFDQVFGDGSGEVHWIARDTGLVLNVDGKKQSRD